MTTVLRIAAPFTLWLIGFSLIYGLHGAICAERSGVMGSILGSDRAMGIAAMAFVAGQAGLALWLRRDRTGDTFVDRLSDVLAIAALIAAIWIAIPAMVLPVCDPPAR